MIFFGRITHQKDMTFWLMFGKFVDKNKRLGIRDHGNGRILKPFKNVSMNQNFKTQCDC